MSVYAGFVIYTNLWQVPFAQIKLLCMYGYIRFGRQVPVQSVLISFSFTFKQTVRIFLNPFYSLSSRSGCSNRQVYLSIYPFYVSWLINIFISQLHHQLWNCQLKLYSSYLDLCTCVRCANTYIHVYGVWTRMYMCMVCEHVCTRVRCANLYVHVCGVRTCM